jgi:glutamate transport system substrate-binding protein
MRFGRIVAVLAVAATALSVTAACGTSSASSGASDSGIIGKAARERKLVIGVKADQPGLGMQTASGYEGFDIEIAKIIAKALGVDTTAIQWRTTASANRETDLQQGKVDLVVATYTINADRKKKVSFAGPYFVAGQDLLVPMNSHITGPENLDGRKVCSVSGSTPAKRIQAEHPNARLQLADTYSRCIEALNAGAVDAVTTDNIILAGYATQPQYTGRFKLVGKPFSNEPYGVGLKKDDVAGCERINQILGQAATDGRYKAAWDATLGRGGTPAPALDTSKFTNCK